MESKTQKTVPCPVKMRPYVKETLWGGEKLKRIYNKKAPFDRIAESWELSARPGCMSIAEAGTSFAGKPLCDVLAAYGISTEDFPLLIKFIDADKKLSVQVHPTEQYAELLKDDGAYSLTEAKTEMWYIIDAQPGARIYYGLHDGVNISDLKAACADGSVESMLKSVEVHRGDTVFIPAGQIHAICEGILLCEIQQNSDTTYRLWDYMRRGEDGSLRKLHIKDALGTAINYTDSEIRSLRFSKSVEKAKTAQSKAENVGATVLADCDFFRVVKYSGSAHIPACGDFAALVCVGGSGYMKSGGESYGICAGDTFFLPPGCTEISVIGADVLYVTCPHQ